MAGSVATSFYWCWINVALGCILALNSLTFTVIQKKNFYCEKIKVPVYFNQI